MVFLNFEINYSKAQQTCYVTPPQQKGNIVIFGYIVQ